MLAQAALLQIAANGSPTVPYTGAVDGAESAGFTAAIVDAQKTIQQEVSQSVLTGTSPHMDGTLDMKTLAVLLMTALGMAASKGSVTYSAVDDSGMITIASNAISNLLAAAANVNLNIQNPATYQSLVQGVLSNYNSSPAGTLQAIQTIEGNFATLTAGTAGANLFKPTADAALYAAGKVPFPAWAFITAAGA